MDIKIGTVPAPGKPTERSGAGPNGLVEARLLAIRPPRRRVGGPPGVEERRADGRDRDPVNGRVLVMLIPDGSVLPEGIESGRFRVFLRFARR